MRTLILNSSNIVNNSGNAVFEYKFPAGAIIIKQGQKLALASLQTYYSNFNITAKYNNNKFSYIWIDGSVVNIVIPDSFLDIQGINNYLHFIMIQNKHYYITTTGDFVYLLTISINPSQYACEINSFQTSASIASSNSWSIPAGATWVNPNNPINPSITIINDFGLLLGFAPATYPSGVISGVPPSQIQTPSYSSTQIFLSSIAPQITPVSSIVLTCSLINNNYAIPTNLIYSYSPSGTFGQQYTIAPNQLVFIDIQAGQYSSFVCQFLDQNLNRLVLQDSVTTILLVISDPDESVLL